MAPRLRRQFIPFQNGQYCIVHTFEGSDLVISTKEPQCLLDYVVYKTTGVVFTPTGEPSPGDPKAMSSALMELFALVHRPLLQHPNVVDELAWGSNPFELAHRLPLVVVECRIWNSRGFTRKHFLAIYSTAEPIPGCSLRS